jgi:hypothetical protein
MARERRRSSRPRPRGPWVAIGVLAVAIVGALLVIGLVGGDDEGGNGDGGDQGEQAGGETTTETQPAEPTEREEPVTPRRVVLRIVPANEVYVCLDTGPGTPIRFEGIVADPQTFRGRRLRLNLGKTDVQVTKNGEPVEIEPGPDPVGFTFTPSATTPLPLGERPCA